MKDQFIEPELLVEQISENLESRIGDLKVLSELALSYAEKARSRNTIKSYASDWKDFEEWCLSKGLKSLPADPCSVACYLAERASKPFTDRRGELNQPLKTSTLARRLSAISQTHQRAGYRLDLRHSSIQETWKGIKNTHGVAQNGKVPILIEDLREFIEQIPSACRKSHPLIGFRDRALLLIGFSGAFRRSELVGLSISDVELVRDGYVVKLRRSKTDQQGSERYVAIPFGSNPLTCPVRALQDWLRISKIQIGPIFVSVNRHGHISSKNLSSHAVALIVKKYVPREREGEFSGHSLRSGFATTAAIAGVSEHSIMKQTGHKRSDTLRKYIRPRDLWKDNPASKIGL